MERIPLDAHSKELLLLAFNEANLGNLKLNLLVRGFLAGRGIQAEGQNIQLSELEKGFLLIGDQNGSGKENLPRDD